MKLLDTNIVVRFLTNDDTKLADQAEALLKDSKNASLELMDVVFMEIVFVLLSVYKTNKEQVIESMSLLIDLPSVKSSKRLLSLTLHNFHKHQISIVDAYLLAQVRLNRNKTIETFDTKLGKLLITDHVG